MLRWGVAKPRATGFWESRNSCNNSATRKDGPTTEPILRHRDKRGESRAQSTAQAKTCANPEIAALSVGSQSPGSDSMGANGILDTGATKTVIGSQLIASFLKDLSPELRARVTRGPCSVLFRFGNQGTLMSQHAMHVPLGPLLLRIAVVPGRTPLLLSNTLMRVLKASLNMESHQLISPHARQPVPLKLSPKGLYLMNVDDLAKSIHGDRLHESTTFLAETDVIEQKLLSREVRTQVQQAGSSRSESPDRDGEPGAAHERPRAEPRRNGCGGHVAGGAGQDQSEDRQDLQRVHIRRDVEEPQELGQVDDQVVREQRQATTQDATALREAEAGSGRDEPAHLPSEPDSQGQEQELSSRKLTVVGGYREWHQDRDGGRDGRVGDGRGRGDIERDRPHPWSGAPVGPHGQHGEHDLTGPHANCVFAADDKPSAVTGCLEQLTRWGPEEAIMFAGDIDAHADERHPEISGHDQQLIQRLVHSYEQEIRQMQDVGHRPGRSMFLFEVFCHPQSQIGQQCRAAQVPFQRFTLERGDLETRAGRQALFRELVIHRPLHVWFAPTCTVWSGWAELNGSKSREAYEQLTERRIQMLHQVALGISILRFQRSSGGHMHWEQPRKSLMNRLACLRELRQLCFQSNFDMCVIGHLECPQTGLPMKKSTTVFTTCQPLHQRLHGQVCTQHVEHQAIEGSILVNGERVNRSRFSENYTRRFARQVVRTLLSVDSAKLARAFAAESEVGPPAAKRVRVSLESGYKIGKRAEPTDVQRLEEPKRQRLLGKQASPIAERERQIHDITPRVGKVEIRDAAILEGLQAVFAEKSIQVIMACRGTDRTIGPPDSLQPHDAPWRRALMIRRSDGALIAETSWEAWTSLAKTRLVRTNHACRLNITAFGSDQPDDQLRQETLPRTSPTTSTTSRDEEREPPDIAGCSGERIKAEIADHPTPERLAQTLQGQGHDHRGSPSISV